MKYYTCLLIFLRTRRSFFLFECYNLRLSKNVVPFKPNLFHLIAWSVDGCEFMALETAWLGSML